MSTHEGRLSRNAESKAMAENDREPWSEDDVVFLMEFFSDARGNPREEREVAEALGRTIEACRQRFYDTRSGRKKCGGMMRRTTTTTTTYTTEYIGAHDEDDDCWWDPEYYK